jgi:hypothetical protein
MTAKILVWLLATVVLTTVPSSAQQPAKIPRIGYVSGSAMLPLKGLMSKRCAKGCVTSGTSREKTS